MACTTVDTYDVLHFRSLFLGAIKLLRNAMVVGVSAFPEKSITTV